ncbi:MAG: selenite/tellurite reduction operon porin ExtI [Thermoanaerobaculia bacterium]
MRKISTLLFPILAAGALAIAPAAWADDAKTVDLSTTSKAAAAAATTEQAEDDAEESEGFDPTFDFEVKGQVFSETTDFGSGLDRQGTRTDVHFQRLRLVVTAMLDDTYGFKFQTCGNCGSSKQGALGYAVTAQDTDWNDRDIRIIDGYAIANYTDAVNFKVGLTKIPLTRANLDDCFAPLTQDRSFFVYTPYGTSPAKFSRDLGAVMWGNLADERIRYYVGAFQGREGLTKMVHPFSGATVTSSIEPSSSFEYVGRVHFAFLDPEPGSGYQGSYLGERKVFTLGLGAALEQDAVYRNVAPNGMVQNEETADMTSWAADMLFEYPTAAGTFTANAQYLDVDFDDAYKTNFNAGDRLANITGLNGQKNGWFAKAAYLLPNQIGPGKVQPYVIMENWEFAHLLGINQQEIEQTGVGVNYYLKGQNVRLTFEYLKTEFATATGFVGGRVDPVTFAPIDKIKEYDTFRVMLQLAVF